MADASYVRSSFTGGEWSKLAQGRYHDPSYVKAMNVCLNGLPVESEAWVRRPGFQFLAISRAGAAARVISFDFEQNHPYTIEFTDGHMRFFDQDKFLLTTNDSIAVVAISTASPAVVQLAEARTWANNDEVQFSGLGTSCPLLQNRVFSITLVDSTHYSLSDSITGAAIDGSTLGVGSLAATAVISRINDIATPYTAGAWKNIRMVQAELTAIMLESDTQPYALHVTALPSASFGAEFSFGQVKFIDGPYLDPVGNGALITPSNTDGLVTMTISFASYLTTKAYSIGDFVFSGGLSYRSLQDANLNNFPPTSPTFWESVSPGVAIGPAGFTGTDVGRLMRVFSEPPLWTVSTSYITGNVVSYLDSNGNIAYYTCLVGHSSSLTNAPGISLTNWGLNPAGAIWSWGKIVSLSSQISQSVSVGTPVGDINAFAGINAAFDGITVQDSNNSAGKQLTSVIIPPEGAEFRSYIGRDFSVAGAKAIISATYYPSSDLGFTSSDQSKYGYSPVEIAILLRGSQTAPTASYDGVFLGQTIINGNQTQAVSVQSIDATTAWNFVWFEIIVFFQQFNFLNYVNFFCAEAQFFSSASGGSGGCTLQILGHPLLYTTPIRVWRMGLYSQTTGWPSCGTYHEGRLWLGGAVANRFDATVSGGVKSDNNGVSFDFTPTAVNGAVTDANGVSYTFNSKDVNPIFWMEPDHQGIICGTKGGEWLIQATTINQPLTPTSIQAHRVTKIGCANIEPRRTEHTLVFVQKFQRKIMEYFADVFSGKFTAPNLAANAKHLTIGNIDELAYQQELAPTVWARVNGSLIGCTYKRDTLMTSQGPSMFGWHRVQLGSNRTVESIAAGSANSGNLDALIMVTNDPATNIRHIEVMGNILDEGASLSDARYLDDCIDASSQVSSSSVPAPYGGLTVNGLWHLNGKIVQAFIGGLDCGDYTVINGSIVVPYGDGIAGGTANGLFTATVAANSTALIGYTYTSQGQVTRPYSREDTGARSGPGFGKIRRSHWMMIQMEGTQGVSFGTDFATVRPAIFKNGAGVTFPVNQQFNGIFRDQFTDDYSFDSMLCWQVTRPYICNVIAIGASLQTQDT